MNKVSKFFRDYSLARFIIPLGIILLIVGCFMFFSIDKTRNYIKTEAIVSRVELIEEEYYDGDIHHDATYKIFVKYSVEDKEYNEEYGVFSGYKEGDKIQISYNPSNPKEIAQPISIILPIVLLVSGIFSLVIGILSIVKTVKKNKKLKLQEEEWKNGE